MIALRLTGISGPLKSDHKSLVTVLAAHDAVAIAQSVVIGQNRPVLLLELRWVSELHTKDIQHVIDTSTIDSMLEKHHSLVECPSQELESTGIHFMSKRCNLDSVRVLAGGDGTAFLCPYY